MKVYACPTEVPAPVLNITNFDYAKHEAAEKAHMLKLIEHLKKMGYTGKRTGGILRMPFADGCATYMMAEGRTSILIHLPYGDGWNSPDVEFLPKREVIKRMDREASIAQLFSKRQS